MPQKEKSKKSLTFEQALEQLEEIAEKLESGELGLDESIVEYEKGMKLARICHEKIETAEKKIQILQKGEDLSVTQKDIHVTESSGEIEQDEDLQGSLL